jgi:hypothetical protein
MPLICVLSKVNVVESEEKCDHNQGHPTQVLRQKTKNF